MAKAVAALLILGSAVSMPLFKISGVTFSGDRILGLLAVVALLGCAIRPGLRWTRIHLALALFVAVQLLTTLLNAAAWPRGMFLVTVYVLGFACFALTAQVTWNANVRRFAVHGLIAIGAVVGLGAGVLAAMANLSGTPMWGTAFVPVGAKVEPFVFGAYATFSEPNFLGSFLLIPFALQLWASVGSHLPPLVGSTGGLRLLGVVVGLAFSYTRAAWIGMAGIALAWTWSQRPSWRTGARLFAAIAAIFALQVATTGPTAFLQRTVGPFLTGTDSTVGPRASISLAMLRSWRERPLVGHGAGAGNRLTLVQRDGRTMHGLWAGNVEVHLLQNSGLLGLAAFLLVLVVVGQEVRQRDRRDAKRPATLGGFVAAGLWLLFAFQFTHALWVMFPYVYLGLLTAEVCAGEEGARADANSGRPRSHSVAQGVVHHGDQ
jgi:hypothetical protein